MISSNDPAEYLMFLKSRHVRVKFPMVPLLLNQTMILAPDWRNDVTSDVPVLNDKFPWPEVFAMAMASVRSDFCLHPPDPRMYSTNDTRLREDMAFFANMLAEYNYYGQHGAVDLQVVEVLKMILKRRIDSIGNHPTISGDKKGLIKRIKNGDSANAAIFFRNIVPAQSRFITNLLEQPPHSDRQQSMKINAINGIVMTYEVFRDLKIGHNLSIQCMSFVLTMFQQRELDIGLAYDNATRSSPQYQPYVPSLFMDSVLDALVDHNRLDKPWHTVYWAELIRTQWCCFICRKQARTIEYIFLSSEDEYTDITMELRSEYPDLVDASERVRRKVFDDAPVEQMLRCRTFVQGRICPCDSGIAITASLSFHCKDCPIVFRSSDLDSYRIKLGHLINIGKFAI